MKIHSQIGGSRSNAVPEDIKVNIKLFSEIVENKKAMVEVLINPRLIPDLSLDELMSLVLS